MVTYMICVRLVVSFHTRPFVGSSNRQFWRCHLVRW